MARGRVLAAAGLAASAALLLAASGTARDAREGGTFRIAVPTGWFDAIDPALSGSSVDVLRPACSSLMHYPHKRLPAGLRLAPDLARSLPTVSKDGRTYTFTIRENARFSNGTPVTARDVVRSLERVLTPAMQSPSAEYVNAIVGAQAMLAGKAKSLAGAKAQGNSVTLRLTGRTPNFPALMSNLCVGPANLPVDPEGARAPIPSAAPYSVAEYVPNARVVLQRNRFYRGSRPQHVDRITVELGVDAGAIDRVARGELDYVWPAPELNGRLPKLADRYGVNRSRFLVVPGLFVRTFFLNTSRPLFKDNLPLRRALNFAVDRRALTLEIGPHVAAPTDQYLPPSLPGFRDERIYPLAKPDLARARALAKGNTRSGKALLYTCDRPDCIASAQILQRNLRPIGIALRIKPLPTNLFFAKVFRPREPFDIAWIGWGGYADPVYFINELFRGPFNISRFNSPTYNRLIDEAGQITGPARYRAYGNLDVRLARDEAPAVAHSVLNAWAFVSARTSCAVMNPFLDLTGVCLK